MEINMRLTLNQITAIKQEVEHFFGATAQVWLFGSRVDDSAKGGDIDLYVQSSMSDADQLVAVRFSFLARLKRRIGDCKIDLVLQRCGGDELPIYQIAKQQGVRL
jgi:predicted nucleotidyltransferase